MPVKGRFKMNRAAVNSARNLNVASGTIGCFRARATARRRGDAGGMGRAARRSSRHLRTRRARTRFCRAAGAGARRRRPGCRPRASRASSSAGTSGELAVDQDAVEGAAVRRHRQPVAPDHGGVGQAEGREPAFARPGPACGIARRRARPGRAGPGWRWHSPSPSRSRGRGRPARAERLQHAGHDEGLDMVWPQGSGRATSLAARSA